MNDLSNEFLRLFRTAVAVMVLFILVIKWMIKARQEKSESKSEDQMNIAEQMEMKQVS